MLDFGSQIAERTVVEEKPTSAAASKAQTKAPAK